jgi:hypothetical protein
MGNGLVRKKLISLMRANPIVMDPFVVIYDRPHYTSEPISATLPFHRSTGRRKHLSQLKDLHFRVFFIPGALRSRNYRYDFRQIYRSL